MREPKRARVVRASVEKRYSPVQRIRTPFAQHRDSVCSGLGQLVKGIVHL